MNDITMQGILESYSLSPMQEGMLFHYLSSSQQGVDIEQIVCRCEEPIDVELFRAAWDRVVNRHAALRTAFEWEQTSEPQQRVHDRVEVPWDVADWSAIDEKDVDPQIESLLRDDRQRGFRLDEPPLMRVIVRQLSSSRTLIVWSFNHIILDGRSFPIVLAEVFDGYDALCRGESLDLPPALEYRPHIASLEETNSEDAESFWRERLAGFTETTPLPCRSAPSEQSSGHVRHQASLSSDTTARLKKMAAAHEVTVNTLLQAAWALVLSRNSGRRDVVFGAIRACRRSSVADADKIVGMFSNTTPVRVLIDDDANIASWLQRLRRGERDVWKHENAPLVKVQQWSDLPVGQNLFDSIVVFDNFLLDSKLRARGGAWKRRNFELREQTNFPLTLYGYLESELQLVLSCDAQRFDIAGADRIMRQLLAVLEQFASDEHQTVGNVSTLTPLDHRRIVEEWNQTQRDYPRQSCVHELFEQQVCRSGNAVAVVYEGEELTYAQLDARANQLANYLIELGVAPDRLVGVCLERGLEMVVAILAIHKAGGAYVPLDPAFPANRVELMMRDSRAAIVLTQSQLAADLPNTGATVVCLDSEWPTIANYAQQRPSANVSAAHLAYVIYTSGSTGRPKGVMVEHGNAVNFFAGMDDCIQPQQVPQPVWLAVTSLSFDISVLELLWTLARGFKVVIYSPYHRTRTKTKSSIPATPLRFGLFYFASADATAGDDKYRLLIEGAKFADEYGFHAVWTPERHFHAFGGLYPNPAVTGAALATITQRVKIRAGSVVLPLHHPVRVAEEWSLVDNLSQGRAGVSFASGWQPVDFVLRPENYDQRQQVMFDGIETVRRLWRGEAVTIPDANGNLQSIRTLPRPIQKELPVWVTTAGNIDTWRSAAALGANVLTHLLGQTTEEVARKAAAYREAYAAAGHAGRGCVTLMLHTFVGDDVNDVREVVRKPMTEYLRSSVGLIKNAASSWTAYKRTSSGDVAAPPADLSELSAEEMDDLLAYSFDRYFSTSGLFGTPQMCQQRIDDVRNAGVDEIACLIDFGVEPRLVLQHLRDLAAVQEAEQSRVRSSHGTVLPASEEQTVGALIRQHQVTHLQCTPSMAKMFLADDDVKQSLATLSMLLVGGEAFPPTLARDLRGCTNAKIVNMYGPTETTVWSSYQEVQGNEASISIGRPIANTQFYILDERRRPAQVGVAGELYIGGDGVVRGYLDRPQLNEQRFVPNPFAKDAEARVYRTGDLARYRSDGSVEFLGRMDQQVKFNGFRIELGEIETVMTDQPDVDQAVVVPWTDDGEDQRLIGYYVAAEQREVDEAQLRARLREQLPDYMVPSRFIAVSEFPHTPNHKIDRRALPRPDAGVDVAAAKPVPDGLAGKIESQVAAIWTDILGISRAGRDDNFFELGGHSLLAVRVHQRLKETFEKKVAITDLFRYPTVRALAAYLDDGSDAEPESIGQQRGAARREALARRSRRRGRR